VLDENDERQGGLMKISAVELDDTDVIEIFVTAMEGGIGYWAVADSYKWIHLYDEHVLPGISLGDDYVLAVLSDTEGDDFKDLKLTPLFPYSKCLVCKCRASRVTLLSTCVPIAVLGMVFNCCHYISTL
jgi:hypothetical protein